jgi:hypothetical protein
MERSPSLVVVREASMEVATSSTVGSGNADQFCMISRRGVLVPSAALVFSTSRFSILSPSGQYIAVIR